MHYYHWPILFGVAFPWTLSEVVLEIRPNSRRYINSVEKALENLPVRYIWPHTKQLIMISSTTVSPFRKFFCFRNSHNWWVAVTRISSKYFSLRSLNEALQIWDSRWSCTSKLTQIWSCPWEKGWGEHVCNATIMMSTTYLKMSSTPTVLVNINQGIVKQ